MHLRTTPLPPLSTSSYYQKKAKRPSPSTTPKPRRGSKRNQPTLPFRKSTTWDPARERAVGNVSPPNTRGALLDQRPSTSRESPVSLSRQVNLLPLGTQHHVLRLGLGVGSPTSSTQAVPSESHTFPYGVHKGDAGERCHQNPADLFTSRGTYSAIPKRILRIAG